MIYVDKMNKYNLEKKMLLEKKYLYRITLTSLLWQCFSSVVLCIVDCNCFLHTYNVNKILTNYISIKKQPLILSPTHCRFACAKLSLVSEWPEHNALSTLCQSFHLLLLFHYYYCCCCRLRYRYRCCCCCSHYLFVRQYWIQWMFRRPVLFRCRNHTSKPIREPKKK